MIAVTPRNTPAKPAATNPATTRDPLCQGYRAAAMLLLALLLSACQTIPQYRLNHRVLADEALVTAPGRILLLPLNVEVKEMSAGGLSDVVPEWTAEAKRIIRNHLLDKSGTLIPEHRITELPPLDDAERDRLAEHTALAKLVWGDAFVLTRFGGSAWEHKAKKFDYSIGSGLTAFGDRTGTDKALLIIAEDLHTTSGRKAMWFMMAALGVAIPLGHSVVVANLIDLNTGDVLWMNTWVSVGETSLRSTEDVATAFSELFKSYPGIEDYRKYVGHDPD